jgi:hypothetical protein
LQITETDGTLKRITERDETSIVCDMAVVGIRSKPVTVDVTNLDCSCKEELNCT